MPIPTFTHPSLTLLFLSCPVLSSPLQVYAEHCLKKAASIQFGKSGDTEGMTGASVELKGVCTDGEDSILVGSGDGTITVLKVAGDTLTITKAFSSSEHTSAINCLCLDPVSGQLISGDDTGKLVFWQGSVGGGFTVLRAIKGEGFPCNSLQAGHGFLVAAFSTGAVHLHSLSKPGTAAASSPLKRIEINAHSRSVSAVDIHPKQRMFATCGEDSFVTVWSLPAASQGTHDMQVSSVKNLLVTSPGTAINTGVKFLGTDHSLIGVTSYDSRFLTVLKTPSL